MNKIVLERRERHDSRRRVGECNSTMKAAEIMDFNFAGN